MNNIQLKKAVMRRVYAVYIVRRLFSGVMLRFYALLALFGGLMSVVSVRDVIANMPGQGLIAVYDFFAYATIHTEAIVQVILFGGMTIALWTLHDAIRSISNVELFRRTL